MCAMKEWQERGQHHGLDRARRPGDGNALRKPRSGVILYLIDELGMDARALETLLYKESGLLGVSGISSDMRTPCSRAILPRARAAIDLFVYRFRRELGSMAAALDGLDAPRLHRRHRRARSGDSRTRLPRRCVARRRDRSTSERRGRSAHQRS